MATGVAGIAIGVAVSLLTLEMPSGWLTAAALIFSLGLLAGNAEEDCAAAALDVSAAADLEPGVVLESGAVSTLSAAAALLAEPFFPEAAVAYRPMS